MTPRIAGFDTRATVGLRPPRSRSRQVDASRGGTAVHWIGAFTSVPSHWDCRRFWRQTQDFHMDGRGWVDLAYNDGVCPHGFVLAGRGAGVRSAAQGTDDGNTRFEATVLLLGPGQRPTQAMLDALAWTVVERRRLGAGLEVRPHSHFRSTGCPGPDGRIAAAALNGKHIAGGFDMSTVPSWAQASWAKARREGVVTDDSRPAANLTYAQMVVLLDRASVLDGAGTVPDYARGAVDRAVRDRVIKAGTATQLVRRYDHLVLAGR